MTKTKIGNEKDHKPVLPKEVIELLKVQQIAHLHSDAQFIDATLGYGGHAVLFIKQGIKVLGIDTDKTALKVSEKKLIRACPTPQKAERCFRIAHGNFKDIAIIAHEYGFNRVYGILFDLGVSSPQLTSPKRGFSFTNSEADLDMRMNPDDQNVTAADLLNSLPEKHLFDLFKDYVDYRSAKKLSKDIVQYRKSKLFKKVADLLELTTGLKGKRKINQATLPFMALRIAVNTELSNLSEALPQALSLLEDGGRIAVISFHSGEDKVVKKNFSDFEKIGHGVVITETPLTPSDQEISINYRARSAKLRVFQKNAKKKNKPKNKDKEQN